ncbi:MAG: lipoprotein-releasing ABC transporter permease subunit [Gammaproteobacteria bacterium]|nr:lipoprotein-releasing ABC transporter permease subunit [Gammaproteobacteria bacterium]
MQKMPIALFIGLRYTRSRKRHHFVSFIAFTSFMGIALGVMVLITVLSVMNGFDEEIHRRFFGMAPEITVNARDGKLQDWQTLAKTLLTYKEVKQVAPFVGMQALVTFQGEVLPVVVTGILPELEQHMSHLQDKLLVGDMGRLSHFGIILGRNLAEHLGVMVDDQVTVMIPEVNMTIAGMIPRFKRFHVEGVFSVGNGFNFDSRLAFIHLNDAQKLMHLGQAVSGLKLKIDEVYAAPRIAEKIQAQLGEAYDVGTWVDQFGAFFQAIKMEKTMMFFILILIIAVAAFNLVSSLVMIVNDKQAEIAILRTMGATPRIILSIFMIQGMMIGCIGTALGVAGGILLAHNATVIVNTLQTWLHIQLISSNIYFVDYLPSKILWSDLLLVSGVALLMSFIATIYPAWRASKTVIAEALHHE